MGVFSFVKAGKKIFNTVKSVKPNVGNLKKNQETMGKLKKTTDAYVTTAKKKGFEGLAKDLRQAGSKSLQKTDKILRKTKKAEGGRIGKMGGGMMDRRMGYSQGSSKGKVPTTPKEKLLAKLAPPKNRITFGDVVAGRTKGKRMQASVGGGADSGRIGQLKSDLKLAKNLTEKRAALQKADKDRNKFNKKKK